MASRADTLLALATTARAISWMNTATSAMPNEASVSTAK